MTRENLLYEKELPSSKVDLCTLALSMHRDIRPYLFEYMHGSRMTYHQERETQVAGKKRNPIPIKTTMQMIKFTTNVPKTTKDKPNLFSIPFATLDGSSQT